jgi:ATP-dependent DNA helicase RecQ
VPALTVDGSPGEPDVASVTRAGHLLAELRLDPAVEVPAGPVLLVDDVARSRWTLTVAAALLRSAGASAVLPVVGQLRP